MKNVKIIEESHKYLTYWLFFVLPFPDKFLPASIVLWIVSWLFWRVFDRKEKVTLSHNIRLAVILAGILVLWNFISVIFSTNPDVGYSIIERRISLVLVPSVLLIGESPLINKKRIEEAYFMGCIAFILFFLLRFTLKYLFQDGFMYHPYVLGDLYNYKHHAYLSLNLILATYLFITANTHTNKFQLFISYLLPCIIILYSESRAGTLGFGIMLLFIVRQLGARIGTIKSILVLILILFLVWFAIYNNPRFEQFLENPIEQIKEGGEPRSILWKSALQLIKEKPMLGYHIAGAKQLLIEKTEENGYINAKREGFNAHNQFLEWLLEFGILGMLLLSVAIFFLIRGIKKEERYIAISVLCFFGFAFLFESMLMRIAGIATFAFVLYYLALPNWDKNDKKNLFKNDLSFNMIIRTMVYLTFVFGVLVLGLILHSKTLPAYNPIRAGSYASGASIVRNKKLPKPLPFELNGASISGACYNNTTISTNWSNNSYRYVEVDKPIVRKGDFISFSVYCYVSEDNDADWVRISTEGVGINEKFYELNQKGTWQKLSLQVVSGEDGEVLCLLYFAKNDCNSFSNMKGNIIYVMPEIKVIRDGNVVYENGEETNSW